MHVLPVEMVATKIGENLVSRGHTPFHKRGKGSGNFRCSRLLHRNSFTCCTGIHLLALPSAKAA